MTAAHTSIPPGFHAYSFLGHFLGPALIDRPLRCEVRRLRDTRSFATRQVLVSQELDEYEDESGDGNSSNSTGAAKKEGRKRKMRSCLSLVADFQVREPASAMVFSAGPRRAWAGPEQSRGLNATRELYLKAGKINKAQSRSLEAGFVLSTKYFDSRHAPGSIMGDTLMGMAKEHRTDQDGLALTDKVSADWIRVPHKLATEAEHVAALAAILDMALSFLALTHDGKFLDEVGANSSLDFAMRLFVNGVDINEWHLREFTTVVGAEGRVYSEARIYNPSGKMVATMSQQAVMRPKPPAKI